MCVCGGDTHTHTHILFIDLGAMFCLMARGSNYYILLPIHTHTQRLHCRGGTYAVQNISVYQSILSVHSFVGPLVAVLLHVHAHTHTGWYFSRGRIGKLVSLFLIGTEIPSLSSHSNPSRGMLINCP